MLITFSGKKLTQVGMTVKKGIISVTYNGKLTACSKTTILGRFKKKKEDKKMGLFFNKMIII